MSKFLGFPRVNYIALKDSKNRCLDLEQQMSNRGIVDYKMIEAVDGRLADVREYPNVNGEFLNQLTSELTAVGISHIKAIYDWLTTTTDQIGFFCEDDIAFDLSDYWNFTWNDFVLNLPDNWKAIQLSLITTYNTTEHDCTLRKKNWDDWSCCAYILSREYAQHLIGDYYNPLTDDYSLTIKNINHLPIPENIVFPDDYQDCYTIPLFAENRNHQSTLKREENSLDIKKIQDQSSSFVVNWWKTIGKNKTVFDILKKDEPLVHNKENKIMQNKIPVIGVPVVNSTYWVARLLMSVDYPVENFVIVNNNGRGEITDELDNLAKLNHNYIDNITVVHMPANIGCAGAWNLVIKCYMNSPYWIIANDDVAFGPGLLKEMAEIVEQDPVVGMVHPYLGDFDLGAWDLFLIRDIIIRDFGLFDENTYPAYCEDADYLMRMVHRPIKKVLGCKNSYLHGPGDQSEYYKNGSQTKKAEHGLAEKLDRVNDLNIDYLTEKWGPEWRTVQPTRDPFGSKPSPITVTNWDIDFVRKKNLGF